VSRIKEQLTYANVVATMALVIALGLGSAWAADKLAKDSVTSKQIKAGAVKTGELADDAVTSPKVADGSLLGKDFAAGQLPAGPTGPQGPSGSPDTAQQLLDKIKQVDGSGSGLDADSVAGIPASSIGTVGRTSARSNCNDDNHDNPVAGGPDCAIVSLTLPRAGRVLLTAAGGANVSTLDDVGGPGSNDDSTTSVTGVCKLAVDGTLTTARVDVQLLDPTEDVPLALTRVTDALDAGAHAFALRCSEADGDIDFIGLELTAVMLGSN
jgi:hypothetical protein